MIDDQRRLVFVHVPKCAGIAVEAALGGLPPGQRHLQHWAASMYVRYYPDVWRTYTRFTIVREPITRALSYVRFIRRFDPIQRRHLALLDESELIRATLMSQNLLTALPMARMIDDDVQILRFERLTDDWAAFAAQHDLPRELTPRNRAPLWTDAAELDPAIRAMIGAIFHADFERFGYEQPSVLEERLSDVQVGWLRWAELRAATLRFPSSASAEDADAFRNWLGQWALGLPPAWLDTWGELVTTRPPALQGQESLTAWSEAIHDDVNQRLGKPLWNGWRA